MLAKTVFCRCSALSLFALLTIAIVSLPEIPRSQGRPYPNPAIGQMDQPTEMEQVRLPVPEDTMLAPSIVLIRDGQTAPDRIVIAAWRDGRVIWHSTPQNLEPTYLEGQVPYGRIISAINKAQRQGLLETIAAGFNESVPLDVNADRIYINTGTTELLLSHYGSSWARTEEDKKALEAVEDLTARLLELVPTQQDQRRAFESRFKVLWGLPDGSVRKTWGTLTLPQAEPITSEVKVPRPDWREDLPVVAVYRSKGSARVSVIAALWEDGTLIWCPHPTIGGPPYLETSIPPDRVQGYIGYVGSLHADKDPCHHFPLQKDGDLVLAVNIPDQCYQMKSNFEKRERFHDSVSTLTGPERLGNRNKQEWESRQPLCYQQFRDLWFAIKNPLLDLWPEDTTGYPQTPQINWILETKSATGIVPDTETLYKLYEIPEG